MGGYYQSAVSVETGACHRGDRLHRCYELRLGSLADVPLKAALHLTMAQALAQCGRSSEAAKRLGLAGALGITGFRELQAAYYFVSAGVLRDQSPWLGRQLRLRASSLWKHQGIVSVPLELSPSRGVESAPPSPLGEQSIGKLGEGLAMATQAVDAIAAIIDLAHTPALMANELLRLIEALNCSAGAKILETRPPTAAPATADDTI